MSEPISDGEPAAGTPPASDATATPDHAPTTAAPADLATATDFDEDDEYEYVDDDEQSADSEPPVEEPAQEIDLLAAQEASVEPPRVRSKTWLLIAAVALAAVAVFIVVDARSTDEPPPPPPQWQRYHNTQNTFSIELPAQPIESTDPEMNLAVNYGARQYGVVWMAVPSHMTEAWTKAEILARADRGARRVRELAIPDSDAAFVAKDDKGQYTSLRIMVRGGFAYMVIAAAFRDDPDAERVLRSFRLGPTPP